MTPKIIESILPYLKPVYLGLCFFILFCGYETTQNYQSGINETDGYISVALIYGCFAIGQFIAPAIIYFITPKYGIFFSGVGYVFYVATNVYLLRPLFFFASVICVLNVVVLKFPYVIPVSMSLIIASLLEILFHSFLILQQKS